MRDLQIFQTLPGIIRKYYKQINTNKYNNLHNIDNLLAKHKLPKLIQNKIEIWMAIYQHNWLCNKKLYVKKSPDMNECCKTL